MKYNGTHVDNRKTPGFLDEDEAVVADMIRIVIVEDQTILRETLVVSLNMEDGFQVISHWQSAEELLEYIKTGEFDVAVVDNMLPGMDGITLAKILKNRLPDAKIIILSMHAREQDVLDAFDAGVMGYLPKEICTSDLIRAIKSVMNGEAVICQKITEALMKYCAQLKGPRAAPEPPSILTEEECRMLKCVSNGYSNKEIADTLTMPVAKVKLAFHELFKKLDARDRTHAVVKALRMGLIGMED
jgi:DNA-binding NarL/FixJ family response regulator